MPLFVVVVEYVGLRHRHAASTSLWYSTAIGYLLMAAMAYGIRDWRYLQLVASLLEFQSFVLFRKRNLYTTITNTSTNTTPLTTASTINTTIPATRITTSTTLN